MKALIDGLLYDTHEHGTVVIATFKKESSSETYLYKTKNCRFFYCNPFTREILPWTDEDAVKELIMHGLFNEEMRTKHFGWIKDA